jgi:poly-gamma-glutamate capsule biosynthesis protein CapA/YwtB (metallophosphatase superfamily)
LIASSPFNSIPRQRRRDSADSISTTVAAAVGIVADVEAEAGEHAQTGRVRLGLAGDTMLGRKVAEAIARNGPESLFADEVVELSRAADLFVLNLECCISQRGKPWPDPRKPFFFRAPPEATEALIRLGTDCVTLANNHALDFGPAALLDTFAYLREAGIAWVGAGRNRDEARAPAILEKNGFRLGVIGCSDHPGDFAAGAGSPGIAYVDLHRGLDWLPEAIARLDVDAVLVTPHWGPNMIAEPLPDIRRAAADLCAAGTTLIAGHSAHVFHGVQPGILFDLGDFVDDYAVGPERNDLGLLFFVTLDKQGPLRLEAVPLKLDYCFTRLAGGEDADWIRSRFREACAALGTEVGEDKGRLVVDWRS